MALKTKKIKAKTAKELAPKRPAGRIRTLLSTRRGALAVMVCALAVLTFYGAGRSLGTSVREIEMQYIEDSKVRYQLQARLDSSMNLMTVTAKYPELQDATQTLRDARNALADAVDFRAPASEVAAANRALGRAVDGINTRINSAAFSAEDEELAKSDIKRVSDAGLVLAKTAYNEAALAFNNKVMASFPTNLIKRVVQVDDAAVF